MDETKNSQQETKEIKSQEQEKKSDELQGKVFANPEAILKEYEKTVVDEDRKTS